MMHNYFSLKTPQNWDSFLTKKYKYGIWNFSHSVARMITRKDQKYRHHPTTEFPKTLLTNRNEYLRKEIKLRENLKNQIIETIDNSLRDQGLEREKQTQINFILDVYKLRPFFKILDEEIIFIKRIMNKKGRPLETRHQIASIWAQVIRDKRGSNWKCIEFLLKWFFDKLKNTVYRNVLGKDDEDFDQYKLKNEYFLIKRDEQKRKNIEEMKDIFFPKTQQRSPFRIEFNKDYINYLNYPELNENGPLITFPDGDTFGEYFEDKYVKFTLDYFF